MRTEGTASVSLGEGSDRCVKGLNDTDGALLSADHVRRTDLQTEDGQCVLSYVVVTMKISLTENID